MFFHFINFLLILSLIIYVMGNNANTRLYIKLPVGAFKRGGGGMYIVIVHVLYSVQCTMYIEYVCTVYSIYWMSVQFILNVCTMRVYNVYVSL